MKRRTRMIRKLMILLFKVMFAIAMVVCLVEFSTAEDVFDKLNYGIWLIIGTILIFRE